MYTGHLIHYDLPGNPPAQGGRQVPHRVLHEQLLGHKTSSNVVPR